MARRRFLPSLALLPLACLPLAADEAPAGVVNPDISVIGQPYLELTDDPASAGRLRPRLDAGETELVFDAALNPYARGFFTFSLHDGHFALEEGYFTLDRGLPGGVALRGGQYRAGFGKLNPAHPHTYPFAERFRVLAAYLPGEEAFTETGLQLSKLFALPGDAALTAAVDWLQGDTFRREPLAHDPEREEAVKAEHDHEDEADEPTRPAILGRLSAFFPAGQQSGLELGVSGTHGTSHVVAAARTTVLGVDAKAKLWTSPRSYLLLQAEALRLDRQDAAYDTLAGGWERLDAEGWGWYAFADYNFSPRWNLGVSYERYERDDADGVRDEAFGLFGGLSLLEETTAFRLSWERYQAGAAGGEPEPDAVDTVTLRMIFSMGPHKAHQF